MANSTIIKSVTVHVGDLVRIHQRVTEGEKERIQIFEGMVLGIRGRGDDRTFTVRKLATGGIGVEKIFPVVTPWISKIEVKKPAGKTRRSKLNYVRVKSARQVAQISVQQTDN
jgi:large subunit ribosomal protein L19